MEVRFCCAFSRIWNGKGVVWAAETESNDHCWAFNNNWSIWINRALNQRRPMTQFDKIRTFFLFEMWLVISRKFYYAEFESAKWCQNFEKIEVKCNKKSDFDDIYYAKI